MRIVIDLQGAQAENSARGIGRYSLSLATAMVQCRGTHEILLALNGAFPESVEHIRSHFAQFLSQESIVVWQAPARLNDSSPAADWRDAAAVLIREAFLCSLKPDFVVVTSLFEGRADDAVTSVGAFSMQIPTAVILYDLIPLLNRTTYLHDPESERWYETKLLALRRSDLLLAISESSRGEALRWLSFPPDKVVNISTAAEPQFKRETISVKREAMVRERYGIVRPFLMYTGGIDVRKNIERLIRAFSLLEPTLRTQHQLAIVCSVQSHSRAALEGLAASYGLAPDEVVLTGFVTDADLLALYHLCKAFVFPSWHEGFGLPALEAMSCGKAVIASNTSSLPEVVGFADATFDPFNEDAIAAKIHRVLSDDAFRHELEQHALGRAAQFSWEASGTAAIKALEGCAVDAAATRRVGPALKKRRLAYFSPLPPERSGISDYSAQLIPELARFYDIDVVVAQDQVSDPWIEANCPLRSVEWFERNSWRFDRVLYHFGNSPFHKHMFPLLENIPGVVVLHDFFLGHITEFLGTASNNGNTWPAALYEEHGYAGLRDRFLGDMTSVAWKFPTNRRVIETALGVIAHSQASQRLAQSWHGTKAAEKWSVIPLMRVPPAERDRNEARRSLGLSTGTFVVSTFGLIAPNKLTDRLLSCWRASSLAGREDCILLMVGENSPGEFGDQLAGLTDQLGPTVRITGWTDTATYSRYLAATDVAVQLRTNSRGETSAAALDCMNNGIATIVNCNGALAELPSDAVYKIADDFEDVELVRALETLWETKKLRSRLRARAMEVIRVEHSPRTCANHYFQAIEAAYVDARSGFPTLARKLSELEPRPQDAESWEQLATDLAQSFPPALRSRQLFVDISELVQRDSKTGIQRVVRSILLELLNNFPEGFRVEPVYATTATGGYRYARKFTSRFLGYPDTFYSDDAISFYNGDVFIGLDLQHHVVMAQEAQYQAMRRQGVSVNFVVYDLLPVLLPERFVPGAAELHQRWLAAISRCDGLICISRAVADELMEWLPLSGTERTRKLAIGYFPLGADIAASAPSKVMPDDARQVLSRLAGQLTFLVVGTIEPRKAHAQVLEAFELLWQTEGSISLVFVGKRGWMVDSLEAKMSNHPERGNRFFWLDGISDEYLELVYAASACLISPSEGEGFGLPLIEAAQHHLPVIARDIPVFREVAEDHALYFTGSKPQDLARAVTTWLSAFRRGTAPTSEKMSWATWKQSTNRLLDVVLHDAWYKYWVSDGVRRFAGSDYRMGTQVGIPVAQKIATSGREGYLLFGPYIALPPGPYELSIHGQLQRAGTGGVKVDIAADRGRQTIVEFKLDGADVGQALYRQAFFLDQPYPDLEIRIWVAADCDYEVARVELAPQTE